MVRMVQQTVVPIGKATLQIDKLYKFFWAMWTRNVFKPDLMPPGPRVGWLYDFLCSFRAIRPPQQRTSTRQYFRASRGPRVSDGRGWFFGAKIAIPSGLNFWSINLRIMNIRVGNWVKLTETPKKTSFQGESTTVLETFFLGGVFFHGKKLSFLDMETRIPERGPQTELSTVAWRGSTRTLDGSKNNEGSLTMMRFLVKLRGNVDIY